MIIRSFYDIADLLELSPDLHVIGRPTTPGRQLSPGFFAGTAEDHVFVVPSPRGPCLGFGGHLVIVDGATRLGLDGAGKDRSLVVTRAGDTIARVSAPEPKDYVDDDDEMNDFFVWLVGRFATDQARSAYTVR